MDRVAVDIETIPLVINPGFNDPADWTIFAVALGHLHAADTDPEIDVLFRSAPTLRDEGELLSETIDWIANRCDGDILILTYNGEGYDIPILRHRS